MKVSKRTSRRIGCAYLTLSFFVLILQPILLTLKCTGNITWDWLAVLAPFIIVATLPIALIIGVVFALIPAELWKMWKTAKRVDKEAEKYGMRRLPGESTGELKKRIIRRNMIEKRTKEVKTHDNEHTDGNA